MSQTAAPDAVELREECAACGQETVHDVRVELRTESPDAVPASFSNHPFRITECRVCGHTEEVRLNHV